MKKIFLFAGVLGYSFSSAQQNEFFDIQKHLETKNIYEKKAIINPLSKVLKPGCGTTGKNLWMLPNGNKVIALIQDYMPCIIPDMNLFNMPNIFKPKKRYQSF